MKISFFKYRTHKTSKIGLAFISFALLLLFSLILPPLFVDVSPNKINSLSPATHKLFAKIDNKLNLNVFISLNAKANLANSANAKLQKLVNEKLNFFKNYALASAGKIQLNIIDTQRFSAAENQALDLGFIGLNTDKLHDKFYFGWTLTPVQKQQISKNQLDVLASRDLIFNGTQNLEYQLAEDILSSQQNAKPKLGILAGVDFLPSFNFQTGKLVKANSAYYSLSKNYEIVDLSIQPNANVDLLLAIAPNFLLASDLELTQNLIEQGVPTLLILDVVNEQAFGDKSLNNANMQDFLQPLGLLWQKDFIIQDVSQSQTALEKSGELRLNANLIAFNKTNFLQNPSSVKLNSILVGTPTAFEYQNNKNYAFAPLVKFSPNANYLNAKAFFANDASAALQKNAEQKTRCKNCLDAQQKYFAGIITTDNAGKSELELNAQIHLAVMGDADFLQEKFWLDKNKTSLNAKAFFAKKHWQHNIVFVQNTLDYLNEKSVLLELRNKSLTLDLSPNSKLDELQSVAKAEYLPKIQKLEKAIADLELQIYQTNADLTLNLEQRQAKVRDILHQRQNLAQSLNRQNNLMQAKPQRLKRQAEFLIIYFSPLLIVLIWLGGVIRNKFSN